MTEDDLRRRAGRRPSACRPCCRAPRRSSSASSGRSSRCSPTPRCGRQRPSARLRSTSGPASSGRARRGPARLLRRSSRARRAARGPSWPARSTSSLPSSRAPSRCCVAAAAGRRRRRSAVVVTARRHRAPARRARRRGGPGARGGVSCAGVAVRCAATRRRLRVRCRPGRRPRRRCCRGLAHAPSRTTPVGGRARRSATRSSRWLRTIMQGPSTAGCGQIPRPQSRRLRSIPCRSATEARSTRPRPTTSWRRGRTT